ncbi:hypothetical protein DL98DRAFT_224376 [Cadophora sp. DSE1049]|nr:hypothetical protein DL98DRAFT_224376 [Cadophora sp. DSE1049]
MSALTTHRNSPSCFHLLQRSWSQPREAYINRAQGQGQVQRRSLHRLSLYSSTHGVYFLNCLLGLIGGLGWGWVLTGKHGFPLTLLDIDFGASGRMAWNGVSLTCERVDGQQPNSTRT